MIPLLNRSEAAAKLRVSTRQLFTLTQTGQIAYVRIGGAKRGSVLYREEDIADFVQSRLTVAGRRSGGAR
jgi:hypothetical protein